MPKSNSRKSVSYALIGFLLFGLNSRFSFADLTNTDTADFICDFSNWDQSCDMDVWVNSKVSKLIKQFGPPDEKASDGKGGQYYLYRNVNSFRLVFYVNPKGVIYSWQWQRESTNDNMADFVSNVKKYAYHNNCGKTQLSPEDQQAVAIKSVGTDFALGNNTQFEPMYLNLLGRWYSRGIHVPKNLKKAFQLFSIAAVMENGDAQNGLGDCYRYGRGVKKDLAQAVYWYGKSSNQGVDSAAEKLADLNSTDSPMPTVTPSSEQK